MGGITGWLRSPPPRPCLQSWAQWASSSLVFWLSVTSLACFPNVAICSDTYAQRLWKDKPFPKQAHLLDFQDPPHLSGDEMHNICNSCFCIPISWVGNRLSFSTNTFSVCMWYVKFCLTSLSCIVGSWLAVYWQKTRRNNSIKGNTDTCQKCQLLSHFW